MTEPRDNGILIGGVWHSCAAPVETWHRHGLEFRPGKGARKREVVPDIFVVHVTGGEGAPPQMFATLKQRGLGVEFSIDVEGVIWQHCDPLHVDTFDAGAINKRSVGVEIVNYGYRKDRRTVPVKGRSRPLYECTIHGREIKMARSDDAQLQALVALADVLTSSPLLKIPRAIPRADGKPHGRLMKSPEIAGFAGVLGHLHVSAAKIDPGMDVFDALDAAGYA